MRMWKQVVRRGGCLRRTQCLCSVQSPTCLSFSFGTRAFNLTTKNVRPWNTVSRRTLSTATSTATDATDTHVDAALLSKGESSSLLQVLQKDIDAGRLQADQAQLRAAKRLHQLQQTLVGYTNEPLFDERRQQQQQQESDVTTTTPPPLNPQSQIRVPRGLYLHGSVGTGKSMLMDTFFERVTLVKKQRWHFHAFLADIHERIHALKRHDLAANGRSFQIDTRQSHNPIHRVALQVAQETRVLCLDEFQVTDVADALILSQLFQVLFRMGTVVVSTSNRPPQALYEGGLNRGYFLPFIDLLEKHCVVHALQSVTDYRQLSADQKMYLVVDNDNSNNNNKNKSVSLDDATVQIDVMVEDLRQGTKEIAIELDVGFQRKLTVLLADKKGLVGRFRFEELCDCELGASDFRAVAQHFSVVVLEGVPIMSTVEHDKARRFITLVDELYEAKTALLIAAAAPPSRLFVDANANAAPITIVDQDSGEDVLGVDQAVKHGHSVGALASVQELSFAFQRAASRLTEMTSRGWWNKRVYI